MHNRRCRVMAREKAEIFQALELLFLFNEKQLKLYPSQIINESKNGYIPAILGRLRLLEDNNLLKKETASGKVVWVITPLGCRIRDKFKEIMNFVV